MALADNITAFDLAWSFNTDARAVYDSATQRLFFSGISTSGFLTFYSWDYAKELLLGGTPRSAVMEPDDHDNPALCLLATGKLLTAYSLHNGDSWSARTTNAKDIRTWDSPVNVATGANNDTYCYLLHQAGDTNETVFWFYRREVTSPEFAIRYRTSADDGSTWGGDTTLFAVSGQRPYAKFAANGANRIDFIAQEGHILETATSVYHGYMVIASDGSLTFFQSDGTEVTSPPFNPNEFTQVYDGSTIRAKVWDIAIIGGSPVALFTTLESSNEVHKYNQARYSGGAWTVDEVTTGGTTATVDYLYSPQTDYSGGVCQDPNDANSVFAAREYGAGNFRLERWTHSGTFGSGTWAKADDVSGDTSSVNIRPYCPRGRSPTVVLWPEGSYTSYTNYSTNLRISPAPSWRKAKPVSPTWTSAYAPAGIQGYYLIHEGSGTTVNDLTTNNRDGSFAGTPTWNAAAADDFGPFLSGFATTDYVNIDTLAAAIDETAFPVWIAVLYKTTSTGATNQYAVGIGNNVDADPIFGVITNSGAATTVAAFWRDDDAGTSALTNTTSNSNDGEYHVLTARKGGSTSLQVRYDGRTGASQLDATTTTTFNVGAIGALRRSTVANPFLGEIHAVLVGWGDEPNVRWLPMDLIRGQFAGTFDPDAASGLAIPIAMSYYRQMQRA